LTNCTRIYQHIIDRLMKFREVNLYLSLDGIGEVYEYIRYPARWDTVDSNVRILKEQHGLDCTVVPTVQIYNVLRLPELYRYCDSLRLAVTLNILNTPDWLAVDLLSPSVRKAAAANLLDYHDSDCDGTNKAAVRSLAHYLTELSTPSDPQK